MKKGKAGERFTEVFLTCAIILILLIIYNAIAPENVPSQSIIDLLINNLVNILIAVAVSFFAVQFYETRRHIVSFVIDLVNQTQNLCDTMIGITRQVSSAGITDDEKDIAIGLYCSYARSLLQYIKAIENQLSRSGISKKVLIETCTMMESATDLYELIFPLSSNDAQHTNRDKAIAAIQNEALQYVLAVKTGIPNVLSSIKF